MQNQKRLSGNTPILMVFLAFTIDLVQIGLDAIVIGVVVNRLIDIAVGWLFYRWFKSNGVDFKKTRALIFFGLAFLEMLPGVDAFPLWIIDIIAVIVSVKIEDELGINTEAVLNNPRAQKLLKRGIIGGVTAVAKRSAAVRGILNKSGWPQNNANINSGKQNSTEKRNIDNTPTPNTVRDTKIKEQQNRKSNANNNEQN
ncbi:MAG: hypothetical protein V4469_03700 [Patescibacteria group bacterium]